MSSNQLEFYRARIEQARDEANAATLDHVRERCHRSEAAWTALATRAEKSEQLRAAEAARKATDQSTKDNEEKNIFDQHQPIQHDS